MPKTPDKSRVFGIFFFSFLRNGIKIRTELAGKSKNEEKNPIGELAAITSIVLLDNNNSVAHICTLKEILDNI